MNEIIAGISKDMAQDATSEIELQEPANAVSQDGLTGYNSTFTELHTDEPPNKVRSKWRTIAVLIALYVS
jgi:hypothetical protein